MTRTPNRVAAALTALAATACLVGVAAPADATQPLPHTVYKGDGGQPGVDTTVTFTLRVGKSPGRITKATVGVHCPTASNKVVFKNVKVNADGFFEKNVSFPGSSVARFQLSGHVKTRHKIDVSFQTADSSEPCGNYVMNGVAKD